MTVMLRMSLIMAKMRMLLILMLGTISLTKVMPHICVLSSAPFQILLAFYFLYQMVRLYVVTELNCARSH